MTATATTTKKPTPYRIDQARKLLIALNYNQRSARSAAEVATATLQTDATDVSAWLSSARDMQIISNNCHGAYSWISTSTCYNETLVQDLALARCKKQSIRTALAYAKRQDTIKKATAITTTAHPVTTGADPKAITTPLRDLFPKPVVSLPDTTVKQTALAVTPPLPDTGQSVTMPVTDAFVLALHNLIRAMPAQSTGNDLDAILDGIELSQCYNKAVIDHFVIAAASDVAELRRNCCDMQKAFTALVDLIADDLTPAVQAQVKELADKVTAPKLKAKPTKIRLLVVGLKGDQEHSVRDKVAQAGIGVELNFVPVTDKIRSIYPDSDAVIMCPRWMNHKLYYKVKELGLPYTIAAGTSGVVNCITDTSWITHS